MTAWFDVTVVTRQTISMGVGGQRAFLTTSHLPIPGAVLRGAFAAAWIRRRWAMDKAFQQTFDGDVRFGWLVPDQLLLEPLSVSTCKYHRDAAGHDRWVDEAFREPGMSRVTCGGKPEHLKGRYVGVRGSTAQLGTVTSTAIDPESGTASEGALFARQAHPSGTRFQGRLVGDEALIVRLKDLANGVLLGGRSSVLGGAEVIVDAGRAPELSLGPVVLRTASPSFLVDDAGRPSLDFASALAVLGLPLAHPKLIWANRAITEATGGWHAASRLPKPTEIGLAAGATAVVNVHEVARLETALTRGIGLRRSEGFGWLETVSSPWSPPTEPAVAPSEQALSFADRILGAGLDHDLRSWLAARIREVQFGDEQAVAEALARPRARRLNTTQRELARSILLALPAGERNAMAARLERAQ